MLESKFQRSLISELRERFPNCLVLKNDSGYIQGFPDLLVLYNDTWAALECKADAGAGHQPNQEYYVDKLNRMSYAAFIYPENKEMVLNDISRAFGTER